MLKVIVDRSKWLRGEGSDNSYLHRSDDDKMCCLGFVGLACGLDQEKDLTDNPTPDFQDSAKDPWPGGYNHSAYIAAMEINDSTDIKHRETALQALLKEVGIELEFVDNLDSNDPK